MSAEFSTTECAPPDAIQPKRRPRPLIYIAGPYRAPTLQGVLANIYAAWKDAVEVWRLGGAAICPHTNTVGMTEVFGTPGGKSVITSDDCIDGDLVMIERCDAILMRPGWTTSQGSCREHNHAILCNVKIYHNLQHLLADLRGGAIPSALPRSPHSCPKPDDSFAEMRDVLTEFNPVKLKDAFSSIDEFVASQRADREKVTRQDDPPKMNPKNASGQRKPPLCLVPETANILEAEVMRLGAQKYGPFNWRLTPVLASVYIAACRRHLAQFWDGEDCDAESQMSHLAHARACLGILLDAIDSHSVIDDRPVSGGSSALIKALSLRHESPANSSPNPTQR